MLGVYRILSYLLLPVAFLFGIISLIGLLMGLGNLALLLPVFLTASTTIYIIASFMFLQKGIDGMKPCKPTLRDWIRVNAFVCIFFSVSMLMQSFYLLRNPQMLSEMLDKAIEMQGSPVPKELMMKSMKGVLVFMQVLGGLLLVHIFMGFRLIRAYAHVFGLPGDNKE